MRRIKSVIGALAIIASGAAAASDSWYLGGTLGHYDLDSERAIEGDIEGSQVGLQIGKYLTDNVALELGYGNNIGHDDFNVLTLTSVIFMGDDSADWRPYALLGLNQYDLDDSSNLVAGHNSNSNQVLFGLGVSNMMTDSLQFRADVRGMGGMNEDGEDLGFQLSLNHVFGHKAAYSPAPVTAAVPAPAPVVQEAPEEAPEVRTITIRLNVEFEFNKDTVLAVYGDQLEAIAAAMSVHEDIELVLEGHTDSRGADSYNADLSSRRAAAVKQKLSADYGIASNRISSVGYGESRPVASNETDEGRARNRRVVGEMSFSEVAPD
jgi:OOP family OmpA-OmpF porin